MSGNGILASAARPASDELVAAVDLGSNSFHMIVARVSNGSVQVLDRLREPVRLAAGLDADGNLSAEVMRRACDCLSRFGQRLQGLSPESVRAVGTNTLRRAKNANMVLAAAERALGYPIVVISGIEEARLIYLGVANSLAEDGSRRLVVDIGGGSTEFIVGFRHEPISLESLYLGCVTLSRSYFDDGYISTKRFVSAELAARLELEPMEARFRALDWSVAIGASGTIRSICNILKAKGGEEGITLRGLKQLRDQLIDAGHVKHLVMEGLSQDRAPIFPGGLAILIAAFEALEIERMQVASGALREGLLYDQIGRIRDEDVRDRSVGLLAARNHVDREQAECVQRTALSLLDQVAHDWDLTGVAHARLLRWAAQLHEIGLDIAHSHYHKHGAYMAEHADMMGFAREEQYLLAVLIRAHRRKFPLGVFQTVSREWQPLVVRLAVLLRLAVILHRSRSRVPLPVINTEATSKSLNLRFPEGWLDQHPLTKTELGQETAYLKATGIKLAVM